MSSRSRLAAPTSILAAGAIAAGLVLGSAAVPTAAQLRPVPAGPGTGRRVVVIVERLRNDAGRVMGGLYTDAGTWLTEDHAAADCLAAIHGGRARCVFTNVAPGPVAFAGMHDEDGDGELDRDLVGLPSEGYAFSNDVREPFGPPSFSAASFVVETLRVSARYGI